MVDLAAKNPIVYEERASFLYSSNDPAQFALLTELRGGCSSPVADLAHHRGADALTA